MNDGCASVLFLLLLLLLVGEVCVPLISLIIVPIGGDLLFEKSGNRRGTGVVIHGDEELGVGCGNGFERFSNGGIFCGAEFVIGFNVGGVVESPLDVSFEVDCDNGGIDVVDVRKIDRVDGRAGSDEEIGFNCFWFVKGNMLLLLLL